MLSPRTERDYRQVVERWTRDGCPDPATWVSERSSEATRRNARAALVWHSRVNLGKTLDIPWVRPLQRTVPSAFSIEELAIIREEALSVHRRCRPVIDLLYSTGARLQEACGIALEDVTDTHIVLRDTKRRPGGLQVHRAVPLGPGKLSGRHRAEAAPARETKHTRRGMPASGAGLDARTATANGHPNPRAPYPPAALRPLSPNERRASGTRRPPPSGRRQTSCATQGLGATSGRWLASRPDASLRLQPPSLHALAMPECARPRTGVGSERRTLSCRPRRST